MRARFDKKFKAYYQIAMLAGFILVLSQLVPILQIVTSMTIALFCLYSIWALLDFTKKEYHTPTLVVPIYTIAITILHTLYTQLVATYNVIVPMQINIILGVVLPMTLIVYSFYVLTVYTKQKR